MVLELPLPTADAARLDKGEQRPKDIQDLKSYVCESVTFHDASISGRKLRNGDIESTFKFVLYTEPGVDKLVNMRIEIVSAGQTVGLGFVRNIDAEEGKLADGMVRMTVPSSYLAAEKEPTLRITMFVARND